MIEDCGSTGDDPPDCDEVFGCDTDEVKVNKDIYFNSFFLYF